jgi:large subunit ribosomal protein L4
VSSVDIIDPAGNKAGTAELPAEIFDVTVNIPLIHQVVVAQQAAARQGTHKAKTRGDVSGGGKKPYRQKGTGRARQGSTRAPQFTGGGVVHGPVPRDYAQRTPKKMKAAALRGALSDRARGGKVHVLSGLVGGDTPSTREAIGALNQVGEAGKALVVVARDDHGRARDRAGPAEHLRRAGQRRHRLHDELAGRVLGPRGSGFGRGGLVSSRYIDHRDVLLAPVISEKSYGLLDENKYTFLVHPDANKTQIKISVEKVFGVKVIGVNTINRQGKRKRTRFGIGQRNATRRAIVTVAAGDRIDIFGGPVS